MTKLTAPVLMLLGGLGLAGTASAQCTLDNNGLPVTTSPFTSASTSSCPNNLTFSPFCSGGDFIATGAGVSIFQVNVGTSNSGLLWGVTSSTVGFNPEMALISGTCAAGNACLIDDTNGSQVIAPIGAGTTLLPTPNGPPNVVQDPMTAGTYFLIVSALVGTPTPCGNFIFSLTGTLPVKLEKFSVD